MKTRQLPGLEKPLSTMVLGTMTFGDTVDEQGSAIMLESALEAGVTAVDTANGYSGGQTEEILGRLLSGRRDDVVLATKAGMPHVDADGHAPLSRQGLRWSLEGSLRRLRTEHVEIFYLHQPDRSTSLDETMDTLAALAAEGKFDVLGVSNFAAWQIADVNVAADRAGLSRPVVAQQLYNLLARRIEEEYAEFAQVTELHTMVYNPLGGGLLTGKHQFDAAPEGGRFEGSRLAEMYKERYWDSRLFDAISELSAIADGAGISLVELSMRWLLSKPATGSVLLGGSKPHQLQSNIDILHRGPLAQDIIKACDEVGAQLRGPMPAYNR
ncbi:aldo/keto reductase [Crystallibacter degradans]|uniref:aldo/keto reductase n=1 Tax=Crystallibacter degradans TaxID=2726743 RepID=UPI0014740D1A|nr:aldo/keto reductase [Arthrobacter sp. SF27]NMR29089.1 aldo/keto reductase [Arthrobacter sp. SF27]